MGRLLSRLVAGVVVEVLLEHKSLHVITALAEHGDLERRPCYTSDSCSGKRTMKQLEI